METLKNFKQIMKDQIAVALATSVDEQPNVRIVNFIMKENIPGIIYFATFKGNKKEIEFAQNERVSFTTIPNENVGNIRVSSATVKKSNLTIYQLEDEFVSRVPEYKEIIEFGAERLVIYEVHFSKATVVLDYNNISELAL